MDYRRLFDIFTFQKVKFPQKTALSYKTSLKWKSFSTKECIHYINKVSAGLMELGLNRGDKIALLTETGSPQWNFLDFGMQQIGVIAVPIHATCTPGEVNYILNDASIKYAIVSNQQLYEKVKTAQKNVQSLKRIYTLEKLNNVPFWEELLKEPTDKHLANLEGVRAAIHEDDLATIIYTSGTTGNPKGVMLSHKNIVSNIKATIALVPINCDKRTISFLPMSHIFERMVVYSYIAVGASIYYAESVENVIDNIKEVKPHYFTSVPRLLEKVRDRIIEVGENRGGLQKKAIRWALNLGERYDGKRKIGLGYWMKLNLADILVYRHWRKALGGKVEGVVVGAAALQPKLGRLFSAAGIEIREGYGLTETSPVIAFNRFEPGGVHFGTVGIPIPGVELKIDHPNEDGEGEILVKGPNVMLGYFNNETKTKRVLQDGWFRTGDVGKIIFKRFLKITDRKKDIFKTSRGKYVAPQVVENKLNASAYIEQSMVLGFNRPYVTALVLPHFQRLKQWCDANKVHWTAPQYMVINPKVVEFMNGIIEEINQNLSSPEQVRKVHLLFEEWSVENGEITPTLKLKRPFIKEKYQKEIDEIYS